MAMMLLLCNYQMIAQEDRQKEKKLVFIIVDGIAADMIPKTSTPNLDAISLKGDFSEAYVGGRKGTYSETPTISAVGYNSLLTGVWVNKHNVYGNEIKQPNYNYPSIFFLSQIYIDIVFFQLENQSSSTKKSLNYFHYCQDLHPLFHLHTSFDLIANYLNEI